MPDYGRPVEFGWFASPVADDLPEVLSAVRAAEQSGLDLVGIQDHPYQRRFLDTWTLISVLAARTERLRFFPDVANLPLRPPAVLAKAAASLDVVTGGRIELGLGAGGFWDAIEAYGGPRRSPGEARAALSEAIDVIRLMWSGQRGLRFTGQHYRLVGAQPGPAPAHEIGIWLGVAGPRMLELLGRKADGWVPSMSYVPPERLAPMHRAIDDGARAAGREPAGIRRLYNVNGKITQGSGGGGWLNGPVQQWIEQLTELTLDYGMDTFVLWSEGDQERAVRVFAQEVAPGVREAVAAGRPAAT